jgi:hypothetical protein
MKPEKGLRHQERSANESVCFDLLFEEDVLHPLHSPFFQSNTIPAQLLLEPLSLALQQSLRSAYILTMEAQHEYPSVHWIWRGGISFVYEEEQFKKELEIYKTFYQHRPCPSIVRCFYYTGNGIFLEYMRGTL